nr:MAG TPA: hypothetical protein [Caudoviricetes sp.]
MPLASFCSEFPFAQAHQIFLSKSLKLDFSINK